MPEKGEHKFAFSLEDLAREIVESSTDPTALPGDGSAQEVLLKRALDRLNGHKIFQPSDYAGHEVSICRVLFSGINGHEELVALIIANHQVVSHCQ